MSTSYFDVPIFFDDDFEPTDAEMKPVLDLIADFRRKGVFLPETSAVSAEWRRGFQIEPPAITTNTAVALSILATGVSEYRHVQERATGEGSETRPAVKAYLALLLRTIETIGSASAELEALIGGEYYVEMPAVARHALAAAYMKRHGGERPEWSPFPDSALRFPDPLGWSAGGMSSLTADLARWAEAAAKLTGDAGKEFERPGRSSGSIDGLFADHCLAAWGELAPPDVRPVPKLFQRWIETAMKMGGITPKTDLMIKARETIAARWAASA